jgi:hypothetical protein
MKALCAEMSRINMGINKTVKNRFYSVLTYVLLVAFTGVFTACNAGGGKKSSPQPPPIVGPIPINPCPTCVGMGNMVFMATTDSENVRGSLYLGLDFYGDPARGFDFNNPKIPVLYSGPVQAHGRMQVRAVDPDLCNAPPGDYDVRTMSPGNWQNGVTGTAMSGLGPNNLQLEARSPNGFYFVVSFAQGIIYNGTSMNGTNKLETNRMGGTFLVQSLNGQICRSLLGSAISLELF